MKNKKIIAKNRLLKFLLSGGKVSMADAFYKVGICNLWARVSELRNEGWPIIKQPESHGAPVVYSIDLKRAEEHPKFNSWLQELGLEKKKDVAQFHLSNASQTANSSSTL